VFAGGWNDSLGANVNIIDYMTIATTGAWTDFGDLLSTVQWPGGCSNSTRGIFSGGGNNVIQYITIASTGNAVDFGDLIIGGNCEGTAGTASSTRGIFAGGNDAGTVSNVIQYITIATTGNASDFGDLTAARRQLGATSNAHGGL